MNKKQGKSKAGLILLLVVVIIVAFYYNSKNNVRIAKGDDSASATVQTYHEAIKLRSELGDNTPYPDVYLYTELLKKQKNYSDEEAVDQAEKRYTEAAAFEWYAEQNGIEPTEEELKAHIADRIKKAKEAEDYKEIHEICKEKGIIFENLFEGNSSFYNTEVYTEKVYNMWKENYDEAHKGENSLLNKFNMEWKDFVKAVVDEYEESDDYAAKAKAIRNSKKAYLDNSTIEEMKKAAIFY